MTDQPQTEPFRSWAIVEIFGHERLAGEVSEQTIAGAGFIRVDVPAVDGAPAFTRFYGDKAIYSITPVDEQTARRAALAMRARPVTVYLAPALPPGPETPDHYRDAGPLVDYDDEDNFDDDDDRDFD
ncbi:MAG: hypothetical protein IT318_23875 [Anaerolineales bacterium]|nr:hypothetical protein [Anaerolineales bacterium]